LDMRRFVSVTTAGSFPHVIFPLWETITSTNRGNSIAVYVGLWNNDFYQIQDCTAAVNLANPVCIAANGTRYYAAIRNWAVFGDMARHYYALDHHGMLWPLTTPASTMGSYNATQRTWYKIANGWTDPYTFASNGALGTTYSMAFATGAFFAPEVPMGVVATDTVPATEPCAGWTTSCVVSASPTASLSIGASPSNTATPSWNMNPSSSPAGNAGTTSGTAASIIASDDVNATRTLGYGLGLGLGFGLGVPLILVTIGLLYMVATRTKPGAGAVKKQQLHDVELYADGNYDKPSRAVN